MGDIDDRDAEVVFHLAQVAQDRGAQRGVDHRHRLVGDQEFWAQHHRAAHHQALALAAGQLVRETVDGLVRVEADQLAGRAHLCQNVVAARRDAEIAQRLGKAVVDLVERIVGRVGILEDRLHGAIALAPLGGRKAVHVASFRQDVPLAGPDEAQEQAAEGRLAAARLAHHRDDHRRPGRHREGEGLERLVAFAVEQAALIGLRHALQRDHRRLGGRGRLAHHGGCGGAPFEGGNAVDQFARIGILRRAENLAHRARFHEQAAPQHHDAVDELGHQAHVVADQDDGAGELALDAGAGFP